MTDMEQQDPRFQLEGVPESDVWVTLREASERAGVSVSTIRRWCRSDEISSRLETRSRGERRIVRLAEVIEKSDFRKSRNREVDVVLLPANQTEEQTAAGQVTVEILPSPESSVEEASEPSGQLKDALAQLASAQDRAVRAELHYGFEVQRRNALEERVARLEALHRTPPASNALGEEDARSKRDDTDRSAPTTDSVTNSTEGLPAESVPREPQELPDLTPIPDPQPATVGTSKEPPPPDPPVPSPTSEKGHFDPEGIWIPITNAKGHFDSEGIWIPIPRPESSESETPPADRESASEDAP